MGISDYMDESGSDAVNVEKSALRNVLSTIANKKATYPSEVASYTSLSENQAGNLLRQLKETDVVKRIKPTKTQPDARSIDASNRTGTEGIKKMKKKKWYALNPDLKWYLKTQKGVIVDEFLIPYSDQEKARKQLESSSDIIGFADNRLDDL